MRHSLKSESVHVGWGVGNTELSPEWKRFLFPVWNQKLFGRLWSAEKGSRVWTPELSFFICHITVYVSFHDWAAERSAGREAAFTGLQYHKCTGEISFLVYPPLPEIGPVFRWMQIRNFKAIDHRRWKHFSSLASSVLMLLQEHQPPGNISVVYWQVSEWNLLWQSKLLLLDVNQFICDISSL